MLSCANCWYNPLQYDLLGDEVGFCVEHRKVLRAPEVTTCGRLMRKDVEYTRAVAVNQRHRTLFSPDAVVPIAKDSRIRLPILVEDDSSGLEGDPVREQVIDYGLLGAKIESLAALHTNANPRAEIAFLSLGRAYVNRCVQRGGRWTSGLHMLWWVRKRLATAPVIDVRDLRKSVQYAHSSERLDHLIDLAGWSIAILRLTFLDDVAGHALREGKKSDLHPLEHLLEDAALATKEPSQTKLLRWIERVAIPRFDRALPLARYRELATKLHADEDAA